MRNKPVTMNLADIKILSNFAKSTPRRKKYCKCAIYWIENHRQDRYLVINEDRYLIDGYIQYLVLKAMGEKLMDPPIDIKIKKVASGKIFKGGQGS